MIRPLCADIQAGSDAVRRVGLAAGLALCLGVASAGGAGAQPARPAGNAPASGGQKFNVTTYHYDSLRTGWNKNESNLTPDKVRSSFGLLVTQDNLDDQIDAQPLIVSDQKIVDDHGVEHEGIVYIATESNTIYAIDAETGAIAKTRNLGIPVKESELPRNPDDPEHGLCRNNSDQVGINSTPVIDIASRTIYVVAYTLQDDKPVYHIHALDLGTLSDRDFSPRRIEASRTLKDGRKYEFDASVNRQRPGLLLSKGNVYAAFGSFCDFRPETSRGWVLGWNAGSLEPVTVQPGSPPSAEPRFLTDRRNAAPGDWFLSAIWMSGYGVAADDDGHLFFITGNSGSENTDFGVDSLAESVVKVSGDLTRAVDWFTPPDAARLEGSDLDFGAGGVLLLPDQPGPKPRLAVALGKDGNMYLLDRDDMGHFRQDGPSTFVGKYAAGACFCGQSYFVGSDARGRVVSSGGTGVIVWKVDAAATSVTLVDEAPAQHPLRLQANPRGFFTTVSSNGTTEGTAIIWAVTRPNDRNHPDVTLYALDARNAKDEKAILFEAVAGTWPNIGKPANSNIVPVVANGKVYVASHKMLKIFGEGGRVVAEGAAPARTAAPERHVAPQSAKALADAFASVQGAHTIYGTVARKEGSRIELTTRPGPLSPTGRLTVDIRRAERGYMQAFQSGDAIVVQGRLDANGRMEAYAILHAQELPTLWPPDQ